MKDKVVCTSAGYVSNGAICSHTGWDDTFYLDFNEYVDFLEPQKERTCFPVNSTEICDDKNAGQALKLSKRAGALCMSSKDFEELKSELEKMCKELGKNCSYDTLQLP